MNAQYTPCYADAPSQVVESPGFNVPKEESSSQIGQIFDYCGPKDQSNSKICENAQLSSKSDHFNWLSQSGVNHSQFCAIQGFDHPKDQRNSGIGVGFSHSRDCKTPIQMSSKSGHSNMTSQSDVSHSQFREILGFEDPPDHSNKNIQISSKSDHSSLVSAGGNHPHVYENLNFGHAKDHITSRDNEISVHGHSSNYRDRQREMSSKIEHYNLLSQTGMRPTPVHQSVGDLKDQRSPRIGGIHGFSTTKGQPTRQFEMPFKSGYSNLLSHSILNRFQVSENVRYSDPKGRENYEIANIHGFGQSTDHPSTYGETSPKTKHSNVLSHSSHSHSHLHRNLAFDNPKDQRGAGNSKIFAFSNCKDQSSNHDEIASKSIHSGALSQSEPSHSHGREYLDVVNLKNSRSSKVGDIVGFNGPKYNSKKQARVSSGTDTILLPQNVATSTQDPENLSSSHSNQQSCSRLNEILHIAGSEDQDTENVEMSSKSRSLCASSFTKGSSSGDNRNLGFDHSRDQSSSRVEVLDVSDSKDRSGSEVSEILGLDNSKDRSVSSVELPTKSNSSSQRPKKLSSKNQRKESSKSKKSFTCMSCQKAFSSNGALKRHMAIHSKVKPFQCQFCGKRFSTCKQCLIHVRIHTMVKGHRCEVCERAFSHSSVLKRHMRIHSMEKHLQCKYCSKRFSRKYSLSGHVRIHKKEKPYTCDLCEAEFIQRSDLNKHAKTHTNKRPYYCNVCKKYFTLPSNLKQHLIIHIKGKAYPCDLCNKMFSHFSTLQQHMWSHRAKHPRKPRERITSHPCEVCQKIFPTGSALKRHMKIHSDDKPHQCEVCKKAFSHRFTLKRHLEVHVKEEPVTCHLCEKVCVRNSILQLHLRTHSETWPHQCEFCGKKFSRKSGLTEHVRTHTKERPFRCVVCEKAFATSKTLKNHMRTHSTERPYPCDICDKRFSTPPHLKRHLKTHWKNGFTYDIFDNTMQFSDYFGGNNSSIVPVAPSDPNVPGVPVVPSSALNMHSLPCVSSVPNVRSSHHLENKLDS